MVTLRRLWACSRRKAGVAGGGGAPGHLLLHQLSPDVEALVAQVKEANRAGQPEELPAREVETRGKAAVGHDG